MSIERLFTAFDAPTGRRPFTSNYPSHRLLHHSTSISTTTTTTTISIAPPLTEMRSLLLLLRRPRFLPHAALSQRSFGTSPVRPAVKPFLLADIGEGIRECEVIQWFVEPEARVEQFDKLCEVQSDKASVEVLFLFLAGGGGGRRERARGNADARGYRSRAGSTGSSRNCIIRRARWRSWGRYLTLPYLAGR